jgi:hypothetical protein
LRGAHQPRSSGRHQNRFLALVNFEIQVAFLLSAMAELFIDPDWEFLAAPMYVDFSSPEFKGDFAPSGNYKRINEVDSSELQGAICVELCLLRLSITF